MHSKIFILLFFVSLNVQAAKIVDFGDFRVVYMIEHQVDFGDPWKTIATWTNPTHENKSSVTETASFNATKSWSLNIGWDKLVKAGLTVTGSISQTVTSNFTIPGCVDLATAQWRWLADSIGGAWFQYGPGEAHKLKNIIDTGNIDRGFYNYSWDIKGPIIQEKCHTGICSPTPIPAALWLFMSALTSLGVIGKLKKV